LAPKIAPFPNFLAVTTPEPLWDWVVDLHSLLLPVNASWQEVTEFFKATQWQAASPRKG
jgi:hypothetical protein